MAVVNEPPCESSTAGLRELGSDSDYGDEAEEHAELMDYLALQGTASRAETPMPVTPTATDDLPENSYFDEAIHKEEGRDFASFLEDSSPTDTGEALPATACAEISQVDYEVYDEDEDDLPPFDEWYTSVQARMQAA